MGESPFADEMGKGVDPFNLPQDRPVLSLAVIGQADPGHAGVDFDVDPYRYPRGGGGLVQLGGIFPVEYGLGNAEPGEIRRLRRGGIGENQDRFSDTGRPDLHGLVQIGYAEPSGSGLPEGAGRLPGPVAIGVCLDHSHHPAVSRKGGSNGPIIVLQSVEIDLGPGTFEKIRHGNGPFHRVSIIPRKAGRIKAWTCASDKKGGGQEAGQGHRFAVDRWPRESPCT